jgi:hypothetical protein
MRRLLALLIPLGGLGFSSRAQIAAWVTQRRALAR